MSNKNKDAKTVKEVTVAAEKTQVSASEAAEIKNVMQSAGIEPAPEPPKKVLTLAEREKAIRENADKLKGLNMLRKEQDQLRSWGFSDNGNNARLTIEGDSEFTTTNSRIIAKVKTNLEDLFEGRIQELEAELQTAEI